jgi:hypothetical protein
MSAPPKWLIATSNILSSCAQSVTSVFWKTAIAPLEVAEYCETTAFASGRRARSAKTTLHPFSRRSFAKQRLMPEPAPVTIAVLPSTFIAMMPCRCQREEKRERESAYCFWSGCQNATRGGRNIWDLLICLVDSLDLPLLGSWRLHHDVSSHALNTRIKSMSEGGVCFASALGD